MDPEATRALIERGWPDALTVDPEDLARLRRHDRLEVVRLIAAIAAMVLVPIACVAAPLITALILMLFDGSWN